MPLDRWVSAELTSANIDAIPEERREAAIVLGLANVDFTSNAVVCASRLLTSRPCPAVAQFILDHLDSGIEKPKDFIAHITRTPRRSPRDPISPRSVLQLGVCRFVADRTQGDVLVGNPQSLLAHAPVEGGELSGRAGQPDLLRLAGAVESAQAFACTA